MIKWINKKRNTKGFTLIELVVVIAILGILAALAIPRFTGVMDKSKVKTDVATARTIVSAIALGEAEGDLKITTSGEGDEATTTGPNIDQIVEAKYLTSVPVSAQTKSGFTISYKGGKVDKITVSKVGDLEPKQAEVYPVPAGY